MIIKIFKVANNHYQKYLFKKHKIKCLHKNLDYGKYFQFNQNKH
jgi:hypothetical protein